MEFLIDFLKKKKRVLDVINYWYRCYCLQSKCQAKQRKSRRRRRKRGGRKKLKDKNGGQNKKRDVHRC